MGPLPAGLPALVLLLGGAPAAPPAAAPPSVVDLFLALPEAASSPLLQRDVPEGRQRVLAAAGLTPAELDAGHFRVAATVDPAHGVLQARSIGDGEGWVETFAAYTLPDGAPLLVEVRTEWVMCGEWSTVFAWRVEDGRFTEVTGRVWPTLAWGDFGPGEIPPAVQAVPVSTVVHLAPGGAPVRAELNGCQLEHDLPAAFVAGLAHRERTLAWADGRFGLLPPALPGP